MVDYEPLIDLVGMLEGASIEYEISNEHGKYVGKDFYGILETDDFVVVATWPDRCHTIVTIGRKGDDYAQVVYDVYTEPFNGKTEVTVVGGADGNVCLEDVRAAAELVVGKYRL